MKNILISTFLFSLYLCLSINSPLFGAENEHETVARNFLKYNNSEKKIISAAVLEGDILDPSGPPLVTGYVMHLENGGYILVSASKQLTPIKAYSLEYDFEKLPPAYKEFLVSETEQNMRYLNSMARTTHSTHMSSSERSWDFLLNPEEYRVKYDYTPGANLLATTWNQSYPYNKFLPEKEGERVIAGCVNVAMAQLMKYHGHPATGYGVESYEWNSQLLIAIMNRPFNWQNMPENLDGTQPAYKTDEVALLMKDLGIANRTDFGDRESGASVNINTLVENFRYAGTIKSMENEYNDLFFNTIAGEIDAERPVLLRFPGHVTVADGYREDPTGRKVHVNFGWGGHADGFYFLEQNVEAGNYIFSPDLLIYYDIKPCSGDNCYTNLETEDSIDEQGLNISGKFNYESDTDRYEVYLKGSTSIAGNRGYSNQAFYLSLYDSDYNLLAYGDEPLYGLDLPPGRYILKASLWKGSSIYSYDSMRYYTVEIETGELTPDERTEIDSMLQKPPVIGNELTDLVINGSRTGSFRVLIDARHERDDNVSIKINNTNKSAVEAGLEGNVLSLSAVEGAHNVASRIIVTAAADDGTTEKSFVVMVTDSDVSFGRSFDVSGIFEEQNDFNTHRIILDGEYTINGCNGYSNQAFYSSLRKADGSIINGPVDNTLTGTVAGPGIYFLGASLKENPSGSGYYYLYKPGENDRYVLTVKCSDADFSTETVAGLLGIDLSGIEDPEQFSLKDVILVLRIISRMDVPIEYVSIKYDMEGGGRIGLAEAIHILQQISSGD